MDGPKALYSIFFCCQYNSAYIPSGRKYEKERGKHTLKAKVFRSDFCLRLRHLLFSVWFLMWRGREKGRYEQTRLKTLWFTHSNQRLLWTIYFGKFMAGKSFRKIENKRLADKRGEKCFGQKKNTWCTRVQLHPVLLSLDEIKWKPLRVTSLSLRMRALTTPQRCRWKFNLIAINFYLGTTRKSFLPSAKHVTDRNRNRSHHASSTATKPVTFPQIFSLFSIKQGYKKL